ncbi:hypothetical protein G9C98_006201 [Cotesia typhae]|uniref:DALR anticodon binding domain-containing protein n=1 Tax=Cotesia typhae TaxID=2053667 RepID=A0A8J5UV31_9HYME|nr:hypothetical protein G9C98_006201 [Cotesia typhae]
MNDKHIAEYLIEELINNKNTSIKTKAVKIVEQTSNFKNKDIVVNLNPLAWRSLIDSDDKLLDKSTNILDYYLKKQSLNISGLENQYIEALKWIKTEKWRVKIENFTLGNREIYVKLNKSCLINSVIRDPIKLNELYGKRTDGGNFFIKINEDTESSLTTRRLWLLKNTCENVLKALGYAVEENAGRKLFLTSKSQGKIENGFDRILCGVVKNPVSNAKETGLSYFQYLEQKMKLVREANDSRPVDEIEDQQLEMIAQAVITFEFISVKPSHPCFIKVDSDADKAGTCNRGGTFVLYNLARITKILDKFQYQVDAGKYPKLWDIDKVDLHLLDSEDGRSQLLQEMMRRIYLLKALQIVFTNALEILSITPISRM